MGRAAIGRKIVIAITVASQESKTQVWHSQRGCVPWPQGGGGAQFEEALGEDLPQGVHVHLFYSLSLSDSKCRDIRAKKARRMVRCAWHGTHQSTCTVSFLSLTAPFTLPLAASSWLVNAPLTPLAPPHTQVALKIFKVTGPPPQTAPPSPTDSASGSEAGDAASPVAGSSGGGTESKAAEKG